MPVKKKSARAREVHVLVGTQKGGFRFRSDLRRRSWKIDGPFFAGGELYYSLNNGDSWQLLQAHLPRIYSVETAVV